MTATAPERILVVGDTHGAHQRCIDAVDAAVAAGCTHVLQLGDFGWFPHTAWGRDFIANLDVCASASNITWCFIAGNHDNWDDLDELAAHGPRDDDGFVVAGAALRYIPRPHRWRWGGVRFAALGGAWSIDSAGRTPGVSWWPQEQPTYADGMRLIDGGDTDILVCHDAPGEVDLSPAGWGGNDLGGGAETRKMLDMAIHTTRCQRMWHGHWHWRHTTRLASGCVVDGFGDNTAAKVEHWAVYDASADTLEPGSGSLRTRTPWWTP